MEDEEEEKLYLLANKEHKPLFDKIDESDYVVWLRGLEQTYNSSSMQYYNSSTILHYTITPILKYNML